MADHRFHNQWHHRLEDAFLTILAVALVLLAVSQILLRNLFGVALLWGDPVIRHLVLWASFVGAAVATRQRRHLRIDAALRLLPSHARVIVDGFGSLFACAVCGLLCWIAVRFVSDERMFGGVSDTGLPTWVLQLIFPATFLVVSLRFGMQAWHSFRGSAPDSDQ